VKDLKATGRPKQQIPILPRIGLTSLSQFCSSRRSCRQLSTTCRSVLSHSTWLRSFHFCSATPMHAAGSSNTRLPLRASSALVALALFTVRRCLLFWHISICNGGPLIGPFPKLHSAVDRMNFPLRRLGRDCSLCRKGVLSCHSTRLRGGSSSCAGPMVEPRLQAQNRCMRLTFY